MEPLAELNNGSGFVIGPEPPEAEVAWLRDFVQAKWRRVLIGQYPELAEIVGRTPITAYHTIAHLIDHAAAWGKDSRLFSPSEVKELRGHLSLFAFLGDCFGPYDVADVEHIGYPEIYWRLVRPKHPDDVAGAHADAWFFTLTNHMPEDEQRKIVKVWFPVFSEPGLSGLSVAVDSHKMNLAYTGEMRHGRMKPLLTDSRADQIVMSPLPLKPGQCVAFHVGLLHRGIGHSTDQCRVSIEFAIRTARQ